jgi:phytoene synthase
MSETVQSTLNPLELTSVRKGAHGRTVDERLERMRAAVELGVDAAKAVSVTAMEALRESAKFMGVVSSRGELVDPFHMVDAQVWPEPKLPEQLLEAAYDYCEELTKRKAGNFYHSFKYLPTKERRSICAYYAFCRRADDIADDDYNDRFPGSKGADDLEVQEYLRGIKRISGANPVVDKQHFEEKMAQLFFFRKKLSTAYNCLASTDPIFMALKHTVSKYGIPKTYMDDMITGMEEDFYRNRYETFEDLYSYCYRVASVVGLTCIEIYGYEDDIAKDHAEAWGIFMQMGNILRDVAEDAENNRIYLPLEELARFGITEEDVLAGNSLLEHDGWKPFVEHFISLADTYRVKAEKLLPLLDKRSRYSPAAMMAIYDSVFKKILRSGGDVFTGRVKLTKTEKLWLAGVIYAKHRFFAR